MDYRGSSGLKILASTGLGPHSVGQALHVDHVPILAAHEVALAAAAELFETGLGVCADSGKVVFVDVQHHVMQTLHCECEVEHQLRCFRAVDPCRVRPVHRS